MTKLETVQWHQEVEAETRQERHSLFDGTLLALSVGLALWFVCAALVISTFVHPGALRVPAVNPHGGHSLLLAEGN